MSDEQNDETPEAPYAPHDALRRINPALADLLDGAQRIDRHPFEYLAVFTGPALHHLRALLNATTDTDQVRMAIDHIDGGAKFSRNSGTWTQPFGEVEHNP